MVYTCGRAVRQCEDIFGPLILVDSSKDSNHAGKSFCCVTDIWHRETGEERTGHRAGRLRLSAV